LRREQQHRHPAYRPRGGIDRDPVGPPGRWIDLPWDQPFLETFKVICSEFFIDFISNGVSGIDSIEAYAALKACSGLLPKHSKEFYFFDQILDILVNMRKAADGSTGQM
jgi:hypothetical protein